MRNLTDIETREILDYLFPPSVYGLEGVVGFFVVEIDGNRYLSTFAQLGDEWVDEVKGLEINPITNRPAIVDPELDFSTFGELVNDRSVREVIRRIAADRPTRSIVNDDGRRIDEIRQL